MTPELDQLTVGLAYSGLGLALGFVIGRGVRMSEHNDIPRWRLVVGLTLIAATIYTVVTGVVTAHHDRAVSECQTVFNEKVRAAIEERSAAADAQSDAQIDYLNILIDNPAASPVQRLNGLSVYRSSLLAARARRGAAPIPKNVQCP